MKTLEILLTTMLTATSAFAQCPQPYYDPYYYNYYQFYGGHPMPIIITEDEGNNSSPMIRLSYNNSLPIDIKGRKEVNIKSNTWGGSLRIDLFDPDMINDYLVTLNGIHLSCSNETHPSFGPQMYISKQFSIPMYSLVCVLVNDKKGNSSQTIVFIGK